MRSTERGQQMRARAESGQSLVEFAIILPMLLVLVFGVIEFGVIMMDHIQVENAATVGARTGSLKGSTLDNAETAATTAAEGRLVSCSLTSTPPDATWVSPQQVQVTVSCPFVTGYVQRHPEYADLAVPRSS